MKSEKLTDFVKIQSLFNSKSKKAKMRNFNEADENRLAREVA